MSNKPYVYVAGPLFDEGERWFIEKVDALVQDCGFDTFLPHRDNPPKTADNVELIFRNDKGGIDRCDVVVANLNGIMTDDGTAWEMGYAYAHGKFIIGLFTDWRARFPAPDEVVNLMMQCSMNRLVRSLDELRDALVEWKSTRS
ncbi:MAG: nucleoside 2-deoxyribosyltransferase [Ilumatobacteraceae bacterium]